MRATPRPCSRLLLNASPLPSRIAFEPLRSFSLKWGFVACIGLALGLSACRSQGSSPRPPSPSSACQAITDDEWNAPPPTPSPPPASHVSVWAFATETWLNEQLDRQQPRRLAREAGRSIGAPGRASYEVTRGRLRLEQRGSQILLSMPVSADISVCKPFGSACLRYGKCEPRFRVEASLDASMSENYDWSPPQLSLRTERKCVIGMDVTPRLRNEAERELQAVHRRLVASWPDPLTWAQRGMTAVSQPASLGNGSCVRWVSPALRQRSMLVSEVLEKAPGTGHMETTRQLSWGAELSGQLLPDDACASEPSHARETREAELPPLETVPNLPRASLLFLPERLDLNALHTEAAAQLPTNGTVSIRTLRTYEGGLAALLQLTGSFCGKLWVQGPLTAETGRLAWASLEPSSLAALAPLDDAERKRLREQLTLLSSRVSWKLSVDAWARSAEAESWLKGELSSLRSEVDAQGGQLLLEGWKVGKARISFEPEAVLISSPLRAAVSVERASTD